MDQYHNHKDDEFFKKLNQDFNKEYNVKNKKPVGYLSVKWYKTPYTDKGGGYQAVFDWDMNNADLVAFARFLLNDAIENYRQQHDDD